jgi:polysaccharide deacetylase family protein (PEP-CTERM system associated)
MSGAAPVTNAMTVDVEDYFQVQAFTHCVEKSSWEHRPSRVEANVDRILGLFDDAGIKATFFTLGWIAVRHPEMVRRIVQAGHELASHGWDHTRADAQGADAFRADIRQARQVLEDTGGVPVVGYRAATFSIGASNGWAFRVLQEEGHFYSSSVNPIAHDLYGMPEAPRTPFRPDGCQMWEIPMTTVRLFGRNWPCSGGGYFRLLPSALYNAGLARINAHENRPGIFYFHPWEIDPGQPRISGCGWKSRLRHYTNLGRMETDLKTVLRRFAWDRMDRVFGDLISMPAPPSRPLASAHA